MNSIDVSLNKTLKLVAVHSPEAPVERMHREPDFYIYILYNEQTLIVNTTICNHTGLYVDIHPTFVIVKLVSEDEFTTINIPSTNIKEDIESYFFQHSTLNELYVTAQQFCIITEIAKRLHVNEL